MRRPDASDIPEIAERVNSLVGRLLRRLREASTIGDYSPSQKAALLRLEKDGPATLAALARAEEMRPQSMAAIVSALTGAGLIVGSQDPHDRRRIILTLTPEAGEELRANRGARRDWLADRIESTLTVRERHTLAAGISVLERLLED